MGPSRVFRDAEIPDLLKRVTMLAASTPWNFYVSDRVRKAHHLLETEAKTSFRLSVVNMGAANLLQLDPMYDHQRFQLTHSEVAEAAEQDRSWIRRDDTWLRIDSAKFRAVSGEAERQGLEPNGDGFSFPAMRREEVLGAFRSLGRIEEDESYRAFLRKLLNFHEIEHVPLPAGLAMARRTATVSTCRV